MNNTTVTPRKKAPLLWNPMLDTIPVPGIRKIVNRAAKMKDVVHLSIGQPSFNTPEHIIEAHIQALRDGKTAYTADAGLPELRQALAEYYSEHYGRQLTPANFLITTGATEGMYLALTSLAAPGREFLIVEPTYPLYAPLIRMNGGKVKVIPTRAEDGHQVDPQRVIDSIGMNTFGIILNSPNNPTGAVYPRETMEAIASEAAYRDVRIFSDEVYNNIILDDLEYPTLMRHSVDLDHIIVCSSFSKTFAMPGMRIGWLISSQGAIRKLRRYHMYTTTVANTPAQWAGVAAVQGDRQCVLDMVAEYRRRRDRVVELIANTPQLTGYWPQGAFYILPALPPNTDGTRVAYRMLEEIKVCTVPGGAFGEPCPNSLRISFSCSLEDIELAFDRMIPWLAEQKF